MAILFGILNIVCGASKGVQTLWRERKIYEPCISVLCWEIWFCV